MRAERIRDNSGGALTGSEFGGLSRETRSILHTNGLGERVEITRGIAAIETKLRELASTVRPSRRSTATVRIGTDLIPADRISGFSDYGMQEVTEPTIHFPGACAAPPPVPSPADTGTPTIPLGHGEARVLGIADLMVVEQVLARYELGEIAHIENVLEREKRERKFRTSITTEESLLVETEQHEETEKDLSSSERFELQAEAQNVITENASKDVGLTINASYGPSVDATATANYASTSAKQSSDSTSSSFARETTSRAVNRLQKRTLERRFLRTVQEVEESNLHSFDNSEGTDNISGVYRHVDKIYTAQVVNYGKRLMLEFVVPEPAAFWRYAVGKQPLVNVRYANPDPLGYCLDDGKTFVDLQAQDLNADNYVQWASKYGAEDVEPPPARTMTASASKKSPESMQTLWQGGPKGGSDVFEVDIPTGYVGVSAFVNAYGETQSDEPGQPAGHKLVIQLQEQQFTYSEPWEDQLRFTLRLDPTAKVRVSVNAMRFHNYEIIVTVDCVLSASTYEKWQLETFFAIRRAYETAKARYDNAIEAEKIRDTYEPSFGRTSAENRYIEQTELKRACVSLLTGQRFDLFDAMNRNVAPYGYPEIDFIEARAEGRYIRFLEQAFEWTNMTYLFYPYFWSRKDQWPTLAQLADNDVMFSRFLQAGAARVQVPVRPGFDSTVRNYLAGFGIWDADGNLVNSDGDEPDAVQLSFVDELRSQLGDTSTLGVGTVAVTHGGRDVVGSGTLFSSEDVRRRIIIDGKTYVIEAFIDAERIQLREQYAGSTANTVSYSLAGKLVGQPWEIRLPTSLVKLGDYPFS